MKSWHYKSLWKICFFHLTWPMWGFQKGNWTWAIKPSYSLQNRGNFWLILALQRSQALWAKTAWQKAKNELKEAQKRAGDVQEFLVKWAKPRCAFLLVVFWMVIMIFAKPFPYEGNEMKLGYPSSTFSQERTKVWDWERWVASFLQHVPTYVQANVAVLFSANSMISNISMPSWVIPSIPIHGYPYLLWLFVGRIPIL